MVFIYVINLNLFGIRIDFLEYSCRSSNANGIIALTVWAIYECYSCLVHIHWLERKTRFKVWERVICESDILTE